MNENSEDLRAQFGSRLMVLTRRWRRVIGARLATLDLTDATWPPLFHLLVGGDGVTQKVLAARVGLDDSSMVRPMELLERGGFIERRVDARDRRTRRAYLTAAGRAAAEALRAELLAVEMAVLGPVSDAEFAAVYAVFDRIEGRLGD